ncbi:polysaccharide pyruvyl transferase family protein [Lacticaseibacillus hulanensis]|uniref:polysaccharide pyruvyl transferase family protein n=1 Tax=Lacticaseibacillus hulanensis TaxID=2493111 RepID=UPI000FD9A40D|nr:polysaccharide pyruvyl transferase family protein [Lacticaseibacillus hulanensis]
MIRKFKRLVHVLDVLFKVIFVKKPKIIYFGAATYGNLGDLAITIASLSFLSENSDKYVLCVNDLQSIKISKLIKPFVHKSDIVVFQGGGNFGRIYPIIEKEREDVFLTLGDRQCKLIQMPTSADFCGYGGLESEIRVTKKAMKNVDIFVRESRSQNELNKLSFGKSVTLVPDIVFSMVGHLQIDKTNNLTKTTTNILMIKRNDIESMQDGMINELEAIFNKSNDFNIRTSDTVVKESAGEFDTNVKRNRAIKSMVDEIQSADIVVTDRLHGMILSLVSDVPVIVFDNATHKIRYTVRDWLRDSDFIYYIDNDSSLNLSELSDWIQSKKHIQRFDEEFIELREILQ